MRSAHLLCDEGITGELMLGALVDAGAEVAALQAVIAASVPDVRLVAARRPLREVLGSVVEVIEGPAARRITAGPRLMACIAEAGLAAPVRMRAEAIAGRLLAAEASAHGVDPSHVHLHELGRPKALARILAISQGLEELGIEHLTVGPVALGSGTVDIAHGRMAVPVPAVLHLLSGFEVRGGTLAGELTTPSGAAVLAGLAHPVTELPPMRLERHGRGGQHAPAAADGSGEVRVLTLLVGAAQPAEA